MSDALRAEEQTQHWAVFSTKHTDDGHIIPVQKLAGFFADESAAVAALPGIRKDRQTARIIKFEHV